jgi:hypothetical protein
MPAVWPVCWLPGSTATAVVSMIEHALLVVSIAPAPCSAKPACHSYAQTPVVVNCAGAWGRRVGRMAGVEVPLCAMVWATLAVVVRHNISPHLPMGASRI